jgi:hypothetical protein
MMRSHFKQRIASFLFVSLLLESCYSPYVGMFKKAPMPEYEKFKRNHHTASGKESFEDDQNGNREQRTVNNQFFTSANTTEIDMLKLSEKIFDEIGPLKLLEDKAFDFMKDFIKRIDNVTNNFTDYSQINIHGAGFNSLINVMLARLTEEEQKADKRKDNITGIIKRLGELKIIVEQKIYQIRVKFIESALVCSKPEEKLFDNLLLTEENINKRYKELSLCFHPDKTHWLLEKHKSIGRQLFELTTKFRGNLLQEFEKVSFEKEKFVFHQEKGHYFWKVALDYQHAQKKQWHQLSLLKKEDIAHLSNNELNRLRLYHTKLAYEEQRTCCKIMVCARQTTYK